MTPCLLSIDQGTTGTTALLVDRLGRIQARAYREFRQIYPRPGWVEHNPETIWKTVAETAAELLSKGPRKIVALGMTNQRETTVVWDRRTGRPVHNAIVWQCRRTAEECRSLSGHAALFRERTGLPLDPYFSGTKIRWILRHAKIPGIRHLLFGTVDTWLLWKLTRGRTHATDFTNASRTLLFDISKKRWDPGLCEILGVPPEILPEVKSPMGHFGTVSSLPGLRGVPILGVAGDQQAALFGQSCFHPGQVKNTYGTGGFAMMNTGKRRVRSRGGLLTTLAVGPAGEAVYALEGSVFIAGAAVQWLRDEMKIIASAAETGALVRRVRDNGGVYIVPAFTGLGAPHWKPHVRGIVTGLTRGSGRNHLIRAALESMAYQTRDVVELMARESGVTPKEIAVDGGAAANDFLMQFQADILGIPLVRPRNVESTGLGAAYLAGLKAGVWKNVKEISGLKKAGRRFTPNMRPGERSALLAGWNKALRQAMAD